MLTQMGSRKELFSLDFRHLNRVSHHFNLFSKIPLDEWLGQLKPYIFELHLHDNNKTSDDHLAIGDGTFDFDTLFLALKDKNLIYTIEAHTPEDVLKSMQRLEKYL